jgi:hypothetical protein
MIVGAANGSTALDSLEGQCLRKIFETDKHVEVLNPKKRVGTFDGDGILRLAMALSRFRNGVGSEAAKDGNASEPGNEKTHSRESNLLLLLGASTGGGRSAVAIELPS